MFGAATIPALVVILIYFQVTSFSFLKWDDTTHVTENPFLGRFGYFWTHLYQGFYSPITYSTWSLLSSSCGLSSSCFHTANLVLHTINSSLVFYFFTLVFRRMEPPASSNNPTQTDTFPHTVVAALCAALLFATHPIQVEPVAWISSLKDLLYGSFALAALILFQLAQSIKPTRHSRRHFIFSSVFFVGAMLAKPSAIATLFIAFVIEALLFRRTLKHTAIILAPWLCIAIALSIPNFIAQKRLTHYYEAPLYFRPIVALDTMSFYLKQVLCPLEVLPAYGRSPSWLLQTKTFYWSWFPALVVIFGAIVLRKRFPHFLVGLMLFVSGFFIVSGIVNFAAQENTTVYDRYLYLAMLGPAFFVGTLLLKYPTHRFVRIIAFMLVGIFATKSYLQTSLWNTDETLWRYNVERAPTSSVGLVNLGLELSAQGKLDDAIDLYRRAIASTPADPNAHNNLGSALAQQNKLDEALAHFREALKSDPKYTPAQHNLANYYVTTQQWAQAERELRHILDEKPYDLKANKLLGEFHLLSGSPQRAIDHLSRVIAWAPANAEFHYMLAMAYAQTQNLSSAIAQFRKTLELNPTHRDAQRFLQTALKDQRTFK